MKKTYFILLAALMLGMSAQAQSIPRPKTFSGQPVDGGQFVLVSAYNTNNFSHRTGWDGAVYFGNDVEYEFTAESQEDGTWTFYVLKGEEKHYMHMPDGSGNLNSSDHDTQNIRTEPAYWYVENGDFDGFVKLKPGAGNSEASQPYYLHLNASGEYFVISEPVNGGGWYPDYAGGAEPNPDPDGATDYLEDETGRAVMADHTSENWAFIAKTDFPLFRLVNNTYKALDELSTTAALDVTYYTGYQATIDAALTLYNNGDVTEENAQTIIDMIQAKKALHDLLETARLTEGMDMALYQAISKAQTAFNEKTATDDVNAATAELQEALDDFNMGTGDYTSLVKNPSFEDLSSQGGAMTSNVAAPPTGWNVYINGTQVTTADEVRNAGIANWHGINDDCDGAKDGLYGFGLWTAAVPDYEISQVLEGLDCGTYNITAGVMVGANGSGSRRTTQRLFGNYNTTYFGHAYDYNESELKKGDVKAFADLDEIVTDRTMQDMSVRAYVYDGKLVFGLRTDRNLAAANREAGNSAGGDGWFKVDNFRISKEGYIASDAAAVANNFLAMFKAYKDEYMQKELTSQMQALVGSYSEVTAETPQADINALILSLESNMELLAKVEESIAGYAKLSAAIDDAYAQLEEYYAYSGADAYEAKIEEGETAHDEGTFDNAQIDAYIEELNQLLDEMIKGGVAEGQFLKVIKNGSFEDLSAQGVESGSTENPPVGWTLKLNGVEVASKAEYSATGAAMNWCAINNGDIINAVDELGTAWTTQYTDGTHLWGIWADNMPEVELSQTITGLPAGTYNLYCDMVVPNDWSGYSITTQRIFANHYVQMFSNEGHYSELNETEDMKAAKKRDSYDPEADVKCLTYAGWQSNEVEDYDDDATDVASTLCPYTMCVTFGVGEDGVAVIGFRTNNIAADGTARKRAADGWFKLDNFRLQFVSSDIPTAISQLNAEGQATDVVARRYFTADGREVAQPQRGITIVKSVMSDGSVKSVKILK